MLHKAPWGNVQRPRGQRKEPFGNVPDWAIASSFLPLINGVSAIFLSSNRLGPNIKKSAVQNLNDYEMVIASHLVVPDNISVSWDSIAGLDHVCQELKESLVFPVRHRDMFSGSDLYKAPKGVLLYGPPGKSQP